MRLHIKGLSMRSTALSLGLVAAFLFGYSFANPRRNEETVGVYRVDASLQRRQLYDSALLYKKAFARRAQVEKTKSSNDEEKHEREDEEQEEEEDEKDDEKDDKSDGEDEEN
ncbi:hypothetical protein EDC96DRAFT_548305 [Choanephora cucurbitarum]|nr:hypothetical protein EDC96DRAFT_548305 [Choanephora cucurbitarum]